LKNFVTGAPFKWPGKTLKEHGGVHTTGTDWRELETSEQLKVTTEGYLRSRIAKPFFLKRLRRLFEGRVKTNSQERVDAKNRRSCRRQLRKAKASTRRLDTGRERKLHKNVSDQEKREVRVIQTGVSKALKNFRRGRKNASLPERYGLRDGEKVESGGDECRHATKKYSILCQYRGDLTEKKGEKGCREKRKG